MDDLKFTVEELIFNVCEKSYRNSRMNLQKLRNCGLEEGHRYHLGNNVWIAFFAKRGGIVKQFYWGERPISRDAAIKKLGIFNK